MAIPCTNSWSVRVLTLASVLSMSALAHAQVPASIGTGVRLDSASAQLSVSEPAPPTVQLPIAAWRISETDIERTARSGSRLQPPASQPRSRRASVKKGLQRAAAGAAFGLGGFYLGGILGARIEGNSCVCDDPGLKGFVIGAPIGAIVGAVAGVAMVR